MKIVLNRNRCYVDKSYELHNMFSNEARQELEKLGLDDEQLYDVERNDPRLVEVVERLKEGASDELFAVRIIEIPDDVRFMVCSDRGFEWIEEIHRRWG